MELQTMLLLLWYWTGIWVTELHHNSNGITPVHTIHLFAVNSTFYYFPVQLIHKWCLGKHILTSFVTLSVSRLQLSKMGAIISRNTDHSNFVIDNCYFISYQCTIITIWSLESLPRNHWKHHATFIIYNETDIPWKMTKSHIVHLWFWQYDCYCGVLQHVRVLFFCPVDFRNFTDMTSPCRDIIWPMKCLTDFFIV